jgi:hypothetical protein
MDTWNDDVITNDNQSMDVHERESEEEFGITKQSLAKTVQKSRSQIF